MLCWECNSEVAVCDDGWICPACGQHGSPFVLPVPPNWREACIVNTPYEPPVDSREA